jgi:helix-turn-helix protein
MTHPPDSTESAEARANEPAPRWEVMRIERIVRRVSDAEYADPARRAEMMRMAKQSVDAINRLSRGPPSPPPNGLRTPAIKRRRRAPRSPPPDGLRTPDEAARKLHCSVKTLNAHVAAGELRYVSIGKGTKRPRKMFTPSDLDEFIAHQTRKDSPACRSIASRARHTGTSTSSGEVVAFSGVRRPRLNVKPKK